MLALLTASAAFSLAWAAPSPSMRALLPVAVAAVMCIPLRHHVLRRGARSLTGLSLAEDGSIAVRLGTTSHWQLCGVDHAWVGRWLVVMRLSLPERGDRVSLCLTPGAVDRTRWRQLRAALRQRFADH